VIRLDGAALRFGGAGGGPGGGGGGGLPPGGCFEPSIVLYVN